MTDELALFTEEPILVDMSQNFVAGQITNFQIYLEKSSLFLHCLYYENRILNNCSPTFLVLNLWFWTLFNNTAAGEVCQTPVKLSDILDQLSGEERTTDRRKRKQPSSAPLSTQSSLDNSHFL